MELRELAAAAEARAADARSLDAKVTEQLQQGIALAALDDPRAPDLLLAALDGSDGLGRHDLGREAALALGSWFVRAGDGRLGRAHLERVLGEAQAAADPLAQRHTAHAAAELGGAWAREGDLTRARGALALAAAGDPRTLLGQALVARATHANEEAAKLLRGAIEASRRAASPVEGKALAHRASQLLAELGERVPGEAALSGLAETDLRRALALTLKICGSREGDPVRAAVDAARELIGAEAVELELPTRSVRSPADAQPPFTDEVRGGKLILRLRGGEPGARRDLLARIALTACERFDGLADGSSRVLQLLDRVLGSDLEGQPLLDLATDLAVEATGAARGRLVLVTDERVAQLHSDGKSKFVSRSLVRCVVLTGRPLLVEDAAGAPPVGAGESVGARGLRSVLAAPLLGRRGQVLGVLYLDDPGTVGRFGPGELSLVTGFCARLGAQVEGLLRQRLRSEARPTTGPLVASGPAMQVALSFLEKAQTATAPVLICGESGVGKEFYARAIHAGSSSAQGPFVAVACGSLADELIESELFGHEAGAFTDAHARRAGLFERADGGVLFLEGLGDASPRLQAELLRAVETGEVRPLGGEPRQVSVRVMASFQGDPQAAVEAGRLRQDLFYRLSVLRVTLPPLRARGEDLPALVDAMLAKVGAAGRELGPGALATLQAHTWPGNLRELQSCLERALLDAGSGPLRTRHFHLESKPRSGRQALALNARQVHLLDELRPGQSIRTGAHAESWGISAATAWRDLTDLVAKGLLVAHGKGRGASYSLAPG